MINRSLFARLYRWTGLAIATLLCVLGLSCLDSSRTIAESIAESAPITQSPFSTRGAEIIDATGSPVLLRGINWFGIETDTHAPHGLWARDYKDMLAQMKYLGYNLIRLPFSLQSLRDGTVKGIDYSIGDNQKLEGKSAIEVMDAIIDEAGKQGIFILLDCHRLNDQAIPELWYGDGFTEADWINKWLNLADRYRDRPQVIGADLKNEPHGKASWGTGDRQTDWRLAAERAGNAILKANPNWLIVVEGVEKNVPNQRLQHWHGGNLEGVRNYPVRLSKQNKLVYSPHEYGPGVAQQAWFKNKYYPDNLYPRWEIGFQYIARLKLAPILIGEFGGRKTGRWSNEGNWQRRFVDYIQENNLSFAYWSWNPNSDDTGGILDDNWKDIRRRKQRLLSPLLVDLPFMERPAIARTRPHSPTPTQSTAVNPGQAKPNPSSPTQSNSVESTQTQSNTQPKSTQPDPTRSDLIQSNPIQPSPIQSDIQSDPPQSDASIAIVPPPKTALAPSTPQSKIQNPKSKIQNPPSLSLKTKLDSDWQSGFCARFQITNNSNSRSPDWQLSFRMSDAEIDNDWNGNFNQDGSYYTVTPPNWGRSLYPDQTIDLGFCATKTGSDYHPSNVRLELR
jgi:endoglucanase